MQKIESLASLVQNLLVGLDLDSAKCLSQMLLNRTDLVKITATLTELTLSDQERNRKIGNLHDFYPRYLIQILDLNKSFEEMVVEDQEQKQIDVQIQSAFDLLYCNARPSYPPEWEKFENTHIKDAKTLEKIDSFRRYQINFDKPILSFYRNIYQNILTASEKSHFNESLTDLGNWLQFEIDLNNLDKKGISQEAFQRIDKHFHLFLKGKQGIFFRNILRDLQLNEMQEQLLTACYPECKKIIYFKVSSQNISPTETRRNKRKSDTLNNSLPSKKLNGLLNHKKNDIENLSKSLTTTFQANAREPNSSGETEELTQEELIADILKNQQIILNYLSHNVLSPTSTLGSGKSS